MNDINYLSIGNVTTYVNTIILTISGYIFGLLLSYFGNLPFTESQLASVLSTIVFFIFSYYNAKKHNRLFDQDKDIIKIPTHLNDAQLVAIQNFINTQTGEDTIIVNGESCTVTNEGEC